MKNATGTVTQFVKAEKIRRSAGVRDVNEKIMVTTWIIMIPAIIVISSQGKIVS